MLIVAIVNNMYDNILRIKEIAETLSGTNAVQDQELSKISILFPLMEALGYDSIKEGDISINPKYTEDGSYKMDYGLRDTEDGVIKTFIKVVDFDFDLSLEQSAINKNLNKEHSNKYFIITDCYKFKICQSTQVSIDEITTFNMKDIDKDAIEILSLLRNPLINVKAENTEASIDNIEKDNYTEVHIPENITFEKPEEPYVYTPKQEEKKCPKKKPSIKIIIGSLLILLGIAVLSTSVVLAFKHISDPNNWYLMDTGYKDASLDYHTLTGTLKVSTYPSTLSVIKVEFSNSNIPEGSVITFTVTNTDANTSVSKSIVHTGIIADDIKISDTWKDCNIKVDATLIFDENQTNQAKNKFGASGEKIVAKNGYSKDHIVTQEVYYNYTAIKANIDADAAALKAQQLKENREYLSNFTIVETSTGDIWFYPSGYSTDDQDYNNPNITDNRKSYASIRYNKNTKQAQFYYIAGSNMGNKHVSFSSVAGAVILSDGVNSYTLNTNQGVINFFINEYGNVSGWCRYDLNSVSGLFGILRTVYSASQPTIEFKGITSEEYISNADKKAVVAVMNLWLKYFNTENIVFDTEWIPD